MSALLRWIAAGGLALVFTFALFGAMTRMVDGTAILEALIRVFPLIQRELEPDDEDCSFGIPLGSAVAIGGLVGHYRDRDFIPLVDAQIAARNAIGDERPIQVSEAGVFRFITAFPSGEPTLCPVTVAVDQRLLIRASGCLERSVPITRAWLPHRVLLECEGRQADLTSE